MADISKIKALNNTTYNIKDAVARTKLEHIFFGTCSTAAATETKDVVCADFDAANLVNGAIIFVTFTNTNSVAVDKVKMNVNGTGALAIKQFRNNTVGNLTAVGNLGDKRTYMFYLFDNGTKYWALTSLDSDTVTPAMKGASASAAGSGGYVPAPAAGKQTSFLRGDGTWAVPTNTLNTTGSTDSSKKLFIIGAESQAANPQTYSHDTAYIGTDGCLYSGGVKVLTAHQTLPTMTGASASAAGTKGMVQAPAGSQAKFLRGDGQWVTPTNTLNTTGSTDSSKKLFLIGAESQAANPQTYSQDTAYVGTDGCLYSGGVKVLTAHQTLPTMSAASASAAGTKGMVQAPAGSQTKFLRGDATWAIPTQLGTADVGSAKQGIYLDGGIPKALSSFYFNHCYIDSQGQNNYPWHRFAKMTLKAGVNADYSAIVIIHGRFSAGRYGVVKIAARANSNKTTDTTVEWIIRYGFGENDVVVTKVNSITADTEVSAYIHCSGWMRCKAYILEGSNNGWTLVNSSEVSGTTETDPKTSVEVYKTVTGNVSVDAGNVAHAKTADSATSATSATSASSATKATQDGDGKVISSTYKKVQTAVSDPSASGTSTTFIATVSQNAQGVISATKKTVSTMTGASSSADGTAGLVPKPVKADRTLFLRGDGDWAAPATMTSASDTAAGTAGIVPQPGVGAHVKFLRGNATWSTASDIINCLTEGSSPATLDDYLVAQYAGGGTSTITYHRRKVSNVVNATVVKAALGTSSGGTKFLRQDGTWQTALTAHQTLPTMSAASASAAGTKGMVQAPAGSQTKFLRGDAQWVVPTDTKNTAGATNSTSKLYLVGATSQDANPQTYSNVKAYVGTDNCLYSNGAKVLTAHQTLPTMTGASASAAGTKGMVQAPAGSQSKFLRGDATWQTVVTAHQDISGKADKSATVSTIAYDATNKKITKTINGTTSDVVTAAKLKTDMGLDNVGKEAYLEWGGKNIAGNASPVDAGIISELSANRFELLIAAGLQVEYSRDAGATWTDFGLTDEEKMKIFSSIGGSANVGKSNADNRPDANCLVRFTVTTNTAGLYANLRKFAIFVSTNGSSGSYVTIEKALKQSETTWVNIADHVSLAGWSGWNIINVEPFSTYYNSYPESNYSKIRFTFGITKHTYSGNVGLSILKIQAFGTACWTTPNNIAKTGHVYGYDYQRNVTFPKKVTATEFVGNATSATKATQDGDGNTISSTYKKTQTAVSDPSASGSGVTYIATISQNAQGVISATKSTVRTMGGATSSADGHTGLVPKPVKADRTLFLRGDGDWASPPNMGAANASTAGTAGLVPAPGAGAQTKFLRGDGTWQTVITAHQDISGKKNTQTAVSDPSASGTSSTFIATISQNAQGVITATKKTVATMTGASSSADGAAGLVPKPTKADVGAFLKADGTWGDPPAYSHPSYTARTGKPTANQTPGFGSTFTISQITSDSTGHVTGATDRTVKIPNTAATTSAAGLMSASDKTKLNNVSPPYFGSGYGLCSTEASTAAKVATLSGFVLNTNGFVSIKFTYDVPANATLNINSTGAKPIYSGEFKLRANVIRANDIVQFRYDGTNYHVISIDRTATQSQALYLNSSTRSTSSHRFELRVDDSRNFRVIDTSLMNWSSVITACSNGTYKKLYHVGDEIELELTSNSGGAATIDTITMVLVGFDIDPLPGGTSYAHMTWLSKEILTTKYKWNLSAASGTTSGTGVYGGYSGSAIKTYVDSLKDYLPSNLQNAVLQVAKRHRCKLNSNTVTHEWVNCYMWIPSLKELGIAYGSEEGHDYGHFTNDEMRKAYFPETSTTTAAQIYWTRTVADTTMNVIAADGTRNTKAVTEQHGIRLGFCT